MIDVFDIIAFVVFGVLLTAVVVIVVELGSLPGRLARKWGHPQAAAVNVAGWLGIATGGLLWPLAFIWAFLVPSSAAAASPASRPAPGVDAAAQLARMQAQLDALSSSLRDLQDGKEVHS
jgi:hypothetical protein